MWDLNDGKEIENLQEQQEARYRSRHAARVNAVAVTPDSRFVISGSDDHTVKMWNIDDGTEARTFLGHTAEVSDVAVSDDGRYVISASHDYTIKVWDARNGEMVATFTGDSPMLACAVGELGTIVAGDQSGRIHFLRLETTG